MTRYSIPLGKILGIQIGLDYSWFLILALLTWMLAGSYYPEEFKHWPPLLYWLIGAVTAIMFFGCVLLHELGHSVVALRYKIPVRSITLFLFGGIAQIGAEPPSAVEAKIITHFINTSPDSQHVARVLAVSRYQGFVSPPDANNPQLIALMNRAKRFLGEEAVDRHVRTVQARLRQAARTLLRKGTPEARKRTLEALRDVRAEMRMARQEDGYF
jgi:hypothetical protein